MPGQAAPIANEVDGYLAYLAQQQDAFRIVTHGLTDDQARQVPSASALSVGALIAHVTNVQAGWLADVQAAPELAPDQDASDQGFNFGADDKLADAITQFDEVSARVLQAIRTLPLDTPVPVPPAPWNPRDVQHWSVRWVWLHLIEELARHAGHADIVRESIDGATLYELMAAYEGWPATDWLTPWRPPTVER